MQHPTNRLSENTGFLSDLLGMVPRRSPQLAALVAEQMMRHEPWLRIMSESAREHMGRSVMPDLERRFGVAPRWTAFGFQVRRIDVFVTRKFLTPILAVGAGLTGRSPMRLKEHDLSTFNHIPAETEAFHADAFDAGLALAESRGDGVLDLTPVVQEFDRILRTRNLRDAGVRDHAAHPRWNAWVKLERVFGNRCQ